MIYLDASALVKLVVRESETDALRSHLARMDLTVASSSIASIGLNRAVLRVGGEALLVERAGQVIEQVDLVPVDQGIVESASSLEPAALRSPAASLASALRIGEGSTPRSNPMVFLDAPAHAQAIEVRYPFAPSTS